MASYNVLFRPGKIGNMELKNRIVMPAMATDYASLEDDTVSQQMIDYYEERAKGGTGLIVVECAYFHYTGRGIVNRCLGIDKDDFIPGYRRLTDAVHKHGSKVALQIFHCGRRGFFGQEPASIKKVRKVDILAPSAVHDPTFAYEVRRPKAVTKDEIKMLVDAFAEAARRAKDAGFDAVEIHLAHGYLLSNFLSTISNFRKDEYGGSLENRMRIVKEIIIAVREKVGQDYPLMVRLPISEYLVSYGMGNDNDDVIEISKKLEEYGIDCIDFTGGVMPNTLLITPYMGIKEGYRINLARNLKQHVNIPIIISGRIQRPELAAKVIREGYADFVAMGRSHIADSQIVNKIRTSNIKDIILCIACNQGCRDALPKHEQVGCMLNYRTGREGQYPLEAKEVYKKKKVVVVGGGPAGMQAAMTAGMRGHQVTLYESADNLGGQINLITAIPNRNNFNDVLGYYQYQLTKMDNVKLCLGQTCTKEDILKLKPDSVIIATGCNPTLPEVLGVDSPHVMNGWEAIRNPDKVGKTLLVRGGGLLGCDISEMFAELEREVYLVSSRNEIATSMGPNARQLFFNRMEALSIRLVKNSKISEIRANSVVLRSADNSTTNVIEGVDTVVFAYGSKSNNKLEGELLGKVPEIKVIGDAREPRNMLYAIHEGFVAGYEL